jgi:long-chain acyl-CoA synthetase
MSAATESTGSRFQFAMSLDEAHRALMAPGQNFEIEVKQIGGYPIKTWKNAPPHLRAIFDAGKAWGDLPYLVLDDERVSFAAHAKAASALATVLVEKFGIQKGDRVAIVMRNLPEWAACFWAAVIVGAIVTPLNAWWTGEELEYGLSDSGTKVLFIDAERAERLRDHFANLPALKHSVIVRAAPEADLPPAPGVMRFEDLLPAPKDWAGLPEIDPPSVTIEPDDDATIFYTSGTTGKPKGALGTHRNMITNLMNGSVSAARSFLRRGEMPPVVDPAGPKNAMLLAIPLFHVTASHSILMPAMATGMKLVMMRKWDADRGLELIQEERITHFGGVPAIAWQVIEHPRFAEFDTSSVASVSYGGAPSAAELVRRIVETFPKVQPGQGYGLTETSAAVTNIGAEDYENRPTSCGPPAPVCEVRVVDGEGKDVPIGEVGELWVRGPNVVKGYWNKPEATEAAFGGGWFKTGDLVRRDEEGFIFIVDRAKDMIIRGGENVYCVEVEDILYKHPDVNDAAIVGIPHKVLGEEVGAIVTVKPGSTVTEDALKAWVRSHLANFKVPVKVEIRFEPLPRNPNGKIMKRDLRAVFAPAD